VELIRNAFVEVEVESYKVGPEDEKDSWESTDRLGVTIGVLFPEEVVEESMFVEEERVDG
jgi:hypothetical protein